MYRPYQITTVCRQDIVSAFEESNLSRKAKTKAECMTNNEMIDLAEEMEKAYTTELFWDSLRDIFQEKYLTPKRESKGTE